MEASVLRRALFALACAVLSVALVYTMAFHWVPEECFTDICVGCIEDCLGD